MSDITDDYCNNNFLWMHNRSTSNFRMKSATKILPLRQIYVNIKIILYFFFIYMFSLKCFLEKKNLDVKAATVKMLKVN